MKKLLPFLLILFIVSCKSDKKVTYDPSTISMYSLLANNNPTSINISDFVDSVQYIKLETTPDNLIIATSKVYFDDDKIIVTDKESGQILIFDSNGQYLNKISKRGRGPGEYTDMSSVMYDSQNDQVMVYCLGNKSLLFYDLDGTFVKDIKGFSNGALIRDMINLPSGNFLCYTFDYLEKDVTAEGSGLWEVDSHGKFVKSFFTLDTDYPPVYSDAFSSFNNLSNGNISQRDILFNDIRHFDGDSLIKVITYDIKDNKLKELKGLKYSTEYYTNSFTAQEKGPYIATEWGDENNGLFYSLYSMKDKSTKYAKSFTFDMSVIPGRMTDSNRPDVLLIPAKSSRVFREINNNTISASSKSKFDELTSGMTTEQIENMNPILQLLYVKK